MAGLKSRLLFDTQAVICWAIDMAPPRLIESVQNGASVYVSIASLWEFNVKSSYRDIGLSFGDFQLTLKALRSQVLPIEIPHLNQLNQLGFVAGHKDPFDRLIISQAISESMILVGSDREFQKYSKVFKNLTILWK